MSPEAKENWRQTGSFVLQKTAQIALNTVLSAAVSATDKNNKAGVLNSLSDAFWRESLPVATAADVEYLVNVWTPDKKHWNALAVQLAAEYEKANPKTPEETKAFLNQIAWGLYNATQQSKTP